MLHRLGPPGASPSNPTPPRSASSLRVSAGFSAAAIVEDDPHHDVLMAPERAADAQAIAFTHDPIRFRGLSVDVDLAPLAGALGLRARLEQARHVQPDIQANALAHLT